MGGVGGVGGRRKIKKVPSFSWEKFNMKNIGTKLINMSDIMIYLAMFSTIIDKILWFWVLIR